MFCARQVTNTSCPTKNGPTRCAMPRMAGALVAGRYALPVRAPRMGRHAEEVAPRRRFAFFERWWACGTPSERSTVVRSTGRGGVDAQKAPVLVFDVMDTIVYDPFYIEIPKFFGTTLQELFEVKHPNSWVRFEKGEISEQQMLDNFFKDNRSYDSEGLLQTMHDNYRYLDGMEELLQQLNDMAYEMHAMTNYPEWYKLIEKKLALGRYLNWTFISCTGAMKGLRKPDKDAFEVVTAMLGCPPANILLVDDREANVSAARNCGMDGIVFKNAEQLKEELRSRDLGV
ncbi:unnamed protein product [Ostreobium quekettii]|uniref:Uncharacterized protein n=1 Tax=Ostreobium quekettii TaxID=121088 RepID=A0A8S1J0N0_9CHLO|nr:unnamed protein product [Ostreobium quekettii]|eukprot:evm.model.scf_385.9 EVM.evm.TU.scf_385.9   scf_385:73773-78657(-)